MPNNTPANPDPTRSMTAPRYMEIPTFMRTPLTTDPAAFDIAMIGVPYDGAVTNRPGARHGAREMRNASSMMRSIHHVTRINPYELCRIGDGGDVRFTRVYEVGAAHADITRFFAQFHQAGVVPLAAGGDHSITLPIFRAIAADRPFGMVHVDAHTDTWNEFMGCKSSHGAPFCRAVEEFITRQLSITNITNGQMTQISLKYVAEAYVREVDGAFHAGQVTIADRKCISLALSSAGRIFRKGATPLAPSPAETGPAPWPSER